MTKPRVGFLGVGWIGRHRMQAMVDTGLIEAAAIYDPSAGTIADARVLAPDAEVAGTFDSMLRLGLDGIVIASPSALHAAQSIAALEAGAAVFCQKPLGRDAGEVGAVVDVARAANRLLGVDLSYRHATGMVRIVEAIRQGVLGHVHAIDLVFHNAYGPDKPWFYDRAQSGGGCVIDLGVHLVDLALWAMDFPAAARVSAYLSAAGQPLQSGSGQVEDYAVATLLLESGTVVRLACSWRLHAGRDAEISATFYGTKGGAAFRNRHGSFYDFSAESYEGTTRRVLADQPEDWGGRAAARWATDLAAGAHFGMETQHHVATAAILDRIYAAASV